MKESSFYAVSQLLQSSKIDQQTDVMFGEGGAEKTKFGLAPKKTTQNPSGPPEQVVISAITDGTHPASLFVDFESVDGAVFDVQWFSDAPMTIMVGSCTVTDS